MLEERSARIDAFVSEHLGAGAKRRPLAADASFRRYERVHCDAACFVLMDAPPPQEDVRPFCQMTHWLRDDAGLHAPRLLAEDTENGLLLLEDLGDDSYRKHIEAAPQDEWPLYQTALDALLHMHQTAALPHIAAYDEATYLRELGVFTQWYLPMIGKEELADDFLALWQKLLLGSSLQQNRVEIIMPTTSCGLPANKVFSAPALSIIRTH